MHAAASKHTRDTRTQATRALFGVERRRQVAERPQQPKHLLLVVQGGARAAADRLGARPLVVVDAGALAVEDVEIVAEHHLSLYI